VNEHFFSCSSRIVIPTSLQSLKTSSCSREGKTKRVVHHCLIESHVWWSRGSSCGSTPSSWVCNHTLSLDVHVSSCLSLFSIPPHHRCKSRFFPVRTSLLSELFSFVNHPLFPGVTIMFLKFGFAFWEVKTKSTGYWGLQTFCLQLPYSVDVTRFSFHVKSIFLVYSLPVCSLRGFVASSILRKLANETTASLYILESCFLIPSCFVCHFSDSQPLFTECFVILCFTRAFVESSVTRILEEESIRNKYNTITVKELLINFRKLSGTFSFRLI
jgi:hypothetical protein